MKVRPLAVLCAALLLQAIATVPLHALAHSDHSPHTDCAICIIPVAGQGDGTPSTCWMTARIQPARLAAEVRSTTPDTLRLPAPFPRGPPFGLKLHIQTL